MLDKHTLFKMALDSGQVPNPLFKYTSTDTLLKILENGSLKFSRISDFNDDRECFAIIDCDCSRDEWALYINTLNPELPRSRRRSILKKIMNNPEIGSNWIKSAINGANADLGILCLTTHPNNSLMWAHYADSSKGVCIEFDVSLDLDTFCLPRKVAYNDEACRYNYIKNWIERKRLDSIEPIYHKSAVWSYEDEYRVVRIDGAGFMNFNIEAIRSICFGSKTPANVIDEVKALCEKKNYNHITFTKIHIDPATGHYLRQPV